MDILKKTAVPFQKDVGPDDHRPTLTETYNEADLVSWSTELDLKNEFFPHYIVLALRLTRPAYKKKYQYIPTLESFHLANDRLYLQISSQEYSLRYMLSLRGTMATRGHRLI